MDEKVKLNVWGREFLLDVHYDCYEGESILPSQREAVNELKADISKIDQSLAKVKLYCQERDGLAKIDNDNIFEYVIPECIYVKRTSEQIPPIGLMCKYQFNQDDGLAVVFEKDKITVGSQNILL
ncbi:MAG: hypothetical protein II139_04985 [Lachnospiraceae bacterium]|nr:hypothetical protein [Lachnospiraceae bacterium]